MQRCQYLEIILFICWFCLVYLVITLRVFSLPLLEPLDLLKIKLCPDLDMALLKDFFKHIDEYPLKSSLSLKALASLR